MSPSCSTLVEIWRSFLGFCFRSGPGRVQVWFWEGFEGVLGGFGRCLGRVWRGFGKGVGEFLACFFLEGFGRALDCFL